MPAGGRKRRWWPWGFRPTKVVPAWVAAVALLATVANLVLLQRNRSSGAEEIGSGGRDIVAAFAYLALAGLGSAAIARQPRNRMGWIFALSGLTLSGAALASEYARYALLTRPGSLPGGAAVAWLGEWGWWAGGGIVLTFGLLLFPDGRLPTRRWRPTAQVAGAGLVVLVALHAFAPGRLQGQFSVAENPVGLDALGAWLRPARDWAWILLVANGAMSVTAVLRRLRGAGRSQRRQLQVVGSAGVLAVLVLPLWAATRSGPERPALAGSLMSVALLGIPVGTAAAMVGGVAAQRSVERLVFAREEERRRLRRDLHDGVGPTLAGAALQLDLARDLVRTDPAKTEVILQRLTGQIQVAIADVRRVVDDLRSPVLDQLGLVSAIEERAAYFSAPGVQGEGALQVTVETSGNVGALPAAVEVAAFRIVAEALANASRHGRASSCTVRLAVDGALEVSVRDDGVGLPADPRPGVGLGSMRERAEELGGTCVIERHDQGGTLVRATLPIHGLGG